MSVTSMALLENVSQMQGRKLLIIGDVGVDEYVIGHVRRISPEAPVPVLEVGSEDTRLGLSANVAQNVSSLKGVPFLVSVVGSDAHADTLRRELARAQVSPEYLVTDPSRPTTRKLRVMAQHHHLVRVDYEHRQFLSPEIENALLARIESLLPQCDGVILQDYSKGVLSESCANQVIRLSHQYQKKVLVDPHRDTPLRYYKGADLLKPNYEEALLLAGIPLDDIRGVSGELKEVAEALAKGMGGSQIVITRGKDGMSIFDRGATERIPTYVRQVFDVTGAGDTVIAALSMAWVSGLSLKTACILANYAAGVVVEKVGCVPCTTQELVEFIKSHSQLP